MDFMARRIACLLEEQEDNSKQLRARDLAVELERMQEVLKNLSMQKRKEPTPKKVKEKVLPSNPVKDLSSAKLLC
jgi:hypothetical protein